MVDYIRQTSFDDDQNETKYFFFAILPKGLAFQGCLDSLAQTPVLYTTSTECIGTYRALSYVHR
jgi:hypothetical protein